MLIEFMVVNPSTGLPILHANYPDRLNLIGWSALDVCRHHLDSASIADSRHVGQLVGGEDHACRVVQLDRYFLNAVCRHSVAVVCLAFSWLIVRI